MEAVEGMVQFRKGKVSQCESDVTGYEEILGLLKKEGECRT